MKRWMVIAEPWNAEDEVHVAAAKAWNKTWLPEAINQFWLKSSAVMSIPGHNAVWGEWVHFLVVRSRKFHEGWR